MIDTEEVERADKYAMTFVGSYVSDISGLPATTHTSPGIWNEGRTEKKRSGSERDNETLQWRELRHDGARKQRGQASDT